MLISFLKDEKKCSGKRDVVLQRNAGKKLDGVCKQRGSLKENGNKRGTYNGIGETVVISKTYNKEIQLQARMIY